MNPTKTELRRSLKQARLALSPEERQTKSTAIAGRLWETIDWPEVTTVHCFEPIERLGEVDLTDLITALQTEHPQLKFFTSRQFDTTWQVVSLTDNKPAPAPRFDVIIVPMLCFGDNLQRIGYGGGYYDRFLATQPSAQKIGVCFELGKVPFIPTEPHDIPLDLIVTDNRTYDGQ